MKDKLIIEIFKHLLKQHIDEPLTLELTDRLMKAAVFGAGQAMQSLPKPDYGIKKK